MMDSMLLLAQESGGDSPWLIFAGRLHPLLVHFPIAFVFLAFLFEFWHVICRRPGTSPAARAVTIFAFLGAVASIVAGWFFAGEQYGGADLALFGEGLPEGDETVKQLALHRWGGIAVGILLFIAAVTALRSRNVELRVPRIAFRVTLILSSLLTPLAAHFGGELVYGEGFLLEMFDRPEPIDSTPTPTPTPTPLVDPAPAEPLTAETSSDDSPAEVPPVVLPAVSDSSNDERAAQLAAIAHFDDVVEPIIDRRCSRCHGRRQQKAGLRLQPIMHAFEWEEQFWPIVPGDPDSSELIRRMSLPDDDRGRMPPGGPRMTEAQIAAVAQWIADGAPYAGMEDTRSDLAIETPTVDAADGSASDPEPLEETEPEPAPVVVPDVTPEPTSTVVIPDDVRAAMSARGIVIVPTKQGATTYIANLATAMPPLGDDALVDLAEYADGIVEIDLSRTAITDDGLKAIRFFRNLRMLRLNETTIGDAGLVHVAASTSIESLNLYGTKMSNRGMESIAGGLPNLRRLYVGATNATSAGQTEFQNRRPDVAVVGDLGLD